jgi:endonuclease G
MARTVDTNVTQGGRFARVAGGFEERARAQAQRAAEKFESHAEERRRTVELVETEGLTAVNSPDRIARRVDRLTRYYAGEELPTTPTEVPSADPEETMAAAVERAAAAALPGLAAEAMAEPAPAAAGIVLEKIIGQPDFLGIRYFEAGVAAARAVGRITIRDEAGRLEGYGTGSMVSPRLMLTNHHVLPDARTAALSAVEFNYQDGVDGQPLQPRLCHFDPDSFFVADEERDFALVAVRAGEDELAQFGFTPLIEAEGKALIGEYVTIVQHPRGEKKQVALRENQIVSILDQVLHYEADTEPGSSGSPVFNDQFELIALHHASVRANGADGRDYLNEGIRASRIIKFIQEQPLDEGRRALVDQLRARERILLAAAAPAPAATAGQGSAVAGTETPAGTAPAPAPPRTGAPGGEGAVHLTVPIEVTLRLGVPDGAAAGPAGGAPAELAPREVPLAGEEAITIDPDYANRGGYDPDFLGTGSHSVPLPKLPAELLAKASRMSGGDGRPAHVIPYHHFSVVMNKERHIAFFTAGNTDGAQSIRVKREDDRWFFDPRIPREEQTGEPVYASNPLDRGHLVRRLDPAWGVSRTAAKTANDDTFHFTNCTPQHKDFNQNKTTWAGLEDYVLDNADNRDFKVSVFTGPVFADDDDEYRGVRLPRQFWKVVVMVNKSGELSATGYLLSQESLLRGLEEALRVEALEEFSYGAYRTYQVPLTRIEELTGISFGKLADFDPLAMQEAAVIGVGREIDSEADLVL